MRKRGGQLEKLWKTIPNDTDILLTHGPAKSIMDLADDKHDRKLIAQVGSKTLLNRVMEIKPTVHAFGHIHQTSRFNNYGVFKFNETTFINCAVSSFADDRLYSGAIYDWKT